jgi:hypothetical protein
MVITGGRVDLSEITKRIVRVRVLLNQIIDTLGTHRDPSEDLDDGEKLLIDNNSHLIDNLMEEIAKELRRLSKNDEHFKQSRMYKSIKHCQKVYLKLYGELYGGYTYYDYDIGIEPFVRDFHRCINSIDSF